MAFMSFRKLSDAEAETFRQWVRDNYEPFTDIEGVWHPVSQAEAVRINEAAATYTTE